MSDNVDAMSINEFASKYEGKRRLVVRSKVGQSVAGEALKLVGDGALGRSCLQCIACCR